MFNLVVIFGITAILILIFVYLAVRTRQLSKNRAFTDKITFNYLFQVVKERIVKLYSDMSFEDSLLADFEFDETWARKTEVLSSINRCIEGRVADKLVVISIIVEIIAGILDTDEKISEVYDFEDWEVLPYNVKFETLLHFYKAKHGRKALKELIKRYNIDEVKYIIEDGTKPSYAFVEEEVDIAYKDLLKEVTIERTDKLDIIARLIYQKYKGFGLMDTIDEMDIDGWNIGTSGATIVEFAGPDDLTFHRSCWVQINGRYLHFRFLEFGSMKDIRRIVLLVSAYQSPGSLTRKRGYLVNQMADMSRVAATRPPVADCWAVFVRKFSHHLMKLKDIVDKPGYTNTELALGWCKYLVKGKRIVAVTGRQSSGKTTLMKADIESIDPRLNVRTIEMTAELNVREHYTERNALGLKETQHVSATQIQDFCKKTDAAVTLIGEIATNEVAANGMQGAKVASEFMLFSHHAVTMFDLIMAIRDSLVNSNGGYDMKAAEKLVIDVIQTNIHADFLPSGERFIARVTERIILDEVQDYPEYNPDDSVNSINEIQREYYRRSTDRRSFITSDLIRFDTDTFTYKVHNFPSEGLLRDLVNSMPKEEKKNFQMFIKKWYLDKYTEEAA